jgi:predicted MFS family arabinose efflux permease
MSPAALVALVCAAQVLVQIGAFVWPALLPALAPRWGLSHAEAGWITSGFYGAYLLAVPILVGLTDRIDAKRVYLFGVGCSALGHLLFGLCAEGFWSALLTRALTGIGWAGTYMTAVKLLADHVGPALLSRAVAGHAAGVGIAGAMSYAWAELLGRAGGWPAAFLGSAATAALAWAVVWIWVPRGRLHPQAAGDRHLLDFRPVLRNRSTLAYSLAYAVHTLEMSALRGWVVAFLGFVAGSVGGVAAGLSPVVIATALGLLGTLASVLGNEAAIRLGRIRLVTVAFASSVLIGAGVGFAGALGYAVTVVLLLVYAAAIWLDSSSLTAGAAGHAAPDVRGATLAVHSMLGYAGGFVGPILVGAVLDAHPQLSMQAWGLAFLGVSALSGLALLVFRAMRPDALAGDQVR